MNAIRAAALAIAVAATSPAAALTPADLANGHLYARAPASLDLGAEWSSVRPTSLDRVLAQRAEAAATSYFQADALVALGAFALAGGALATLAGLGASRRSRAECDETREPEWRATVFAAMQQDLARFSGAMGRNAA